MDAGAMLEAFETEFPEDAPEEELAAIEAEEEAEASE